MKFSKIITSLLKQKNLNKLKYKIFFSFLSTVGQYLSGIFKCINKKDSKKGFTSLITVNSYSSSFRVFHSDGSSDISTLKTQRFHTDCYVFKIPLKELQKNPLLGAISLRNDW